VKSTSGPPPCTCDLHRQLSPTRLGQLNCPSRRKLQLQALEQFFLEPLPQNEPIVVLGDPSLLPIMAARVSGRPVVAEGQGRWARRVAEASGAPVRWVSCAPGAGAVLAEPHQDAALLPWENLKFWKRLRSLECGRVLPRAATLWAMPVQFKHLWKIRATLGTCMGFQMLPFDELVMVKND